MESIGEISIAEQLKQRISERFTDSSLQLGQLLEEMPLSAWYQRKLFKEATGMTLTQYLNKIRIDYACSLLANSTMPIKSIAISSGFEDPYYFSRMFKNIKGSNPMLWRDVYKRQPVDHPLRSLENVLITPHIAGDNPDMFRLCGKQAIDTLRDYFSGKEVVDKKYYLGIGEKN